MASARRMGGYAAWVEVITDDALKLSIDSIERVIAGKCEGIRHDLNPRTAKKILMREYNARFTENGYRRSKRIYERF